MNPDKQIKALAELDGFIGCVDVNCCWRKCQHWHKNNNHYFNDSISAPSSTLPPYLTSYDAIIPLVQKLGMCYEVEKRCRLNSTPAQLCEALLRATGKWNDQ